LYPDIKISLGGIYASLMPKHAKASGADNIHSGVFKDVEEIMPAYDLVPEWDGSIITTSRGCNRRCPYCAVWQIEGGINSAKRTIKHLVHPKHSRIILWDNNILQSPYWRDIFEELVEFSQTKKTIVDFNQGIDARLITPEVAEKISQMKTTCVRVSYDHKNIRSHLEKTVITLSSFGIRKRHICVYILFNFLDTPSDLFERVKDVLNLGAVAVPLRYQPLDTLKYNQHVGPKWDKGRLSVFARFRRICGFGGVFPPYKWLLERFNESKSFDEAFSPPPRNNALKKRAHKDFFNSWRRVQDWSLVSEQFLAKKW